MVKAKIQHYHASNNIAKISHILQPALTTPKCHVSTNHYCEYKHNTRSE